MIVRNTRPRPPSTANRLASWASIALAAVALSAGQTIAAEPSPTKAAPLVYIVTCRCAAPAEREAIAQAARRQGGSVVYVYETIPGLAVASPRGADPRRFMAGLRRIATVTDVQVSQAQHLQSASE